MKVTPFVSEFSDRSIVPVSEAGPAATYVPPAGWRRSEKQTTSKFAFEMSNTTNWYRNDGHGNGYFAPGWDNERIARRTGIFRWIGVAVAVIIVIIGAIAYTAQYAEQRTYDRLRAEGIPTIGTIGQVTVEHSSRRARQGSRQYTTTTNATISYHHQNLLLEENVQHTQTRTRDFLSSTQVASSDQYPGPFWQEGQSVAIYYNPARPTQFVLQHTYKEADTGQMPRGALLVLVFTGVFLIVPVLLIFVGMRNVRRAREL